MTITAETSVPANSEGVMITPMAEESVNKGTPETPAPAIKPVSTEAPTLQSLGDLHHLNVELSYESDISPDAKKFLDDVKASVTEKYHEDGRSVEITEVKTGLYKAYCFVGKPANNTFVIIFSEQQVQQAGTTLAIESEKEIVDTIKRMHPEYNVYDAYVIDPTDYSRGGMWGHAISNNLLLSDQGSRAYNTLDHTCFRGVTIKISGDINRVRTFAAKWSPHAVPARCDYGLLFSYESPRQTPTGNVVDEIPFAVVTAYTRICDLNQQNNLGQKQFIPFVTVTDILTPINHRGIAALVIPWAADMFINRNMWMLPYMEFANKEKPNIGNLVLDAEGKHPLAVQNPAEAMQFILQSLRNPPCFAIDIAQGRFMPVFMRELATGHTDQLLESLAAFMGITKETNYHTQVSFNNQEFQYRDPNQSCACLYTNYTGIYNDKGVMKDSRYVDYLNMISKAVNVESVRPLLGQSYYANTQFDLIRALIPAETTRALYKTVSVVFTAPAINWMAETIGRIDPATNRRCMNFITDINNGNNQVSFSNIVNAPWTNSFAPITYGNNPNTQYNGVNPYNYSGFHGTV